VKKLFFDTYHTDLIGGGGLALYNLAVALQNFFDVHLAQPWDDGMARYEFLRDPVRPFKIGRPDNVDVLLASKYGVYVPPSADVNVFYCLYPRHDWNMSGYQKILTLSGYSRKAIKDRWKMDSEILIGGAFYPDYGPEFVWKSGMNRKKDNVILNCARFFREENGHSKNQHVIIEAFKMLPKDLPWHLILAGSVILDSDRDYLNECRRLVGSDPRIMFATMPSKETLRDLYANAKGYVHAMGYGRTDPAETEHYGIAVEKALISGCFAIVHDSGGAPEFPVAKWKTPEELSGLMSYAIQHEHYYHPEQIAAGNQWRTWEAFVERTRKVFDAYA
jgi:glycosyltransferase involved in cell wall biosynthesis